MKALVTIEVPDDGRCGGCCFCKPNFFGLTGCVIFDEFTTPESRALKQCRDAVKRYKEGKA